MPVESGEISPLITQALVCNCPTTAFNDHFTHMITGPLAVLRAIRFLFVGPAILAFLFVINLLTSPGHWWIQWPALGIGIAWFFSLLRVVKALLIVGGLAALINYVSRRNV